MKVAILGCGPAGLVAAHAASLYGHDIAIFSKYRKSEMYGCQYLHTAIPGLTPTDGHRVEYQLEGTVEQYKEKVYGKDYDGTVSPEDLVGAHDAWDIREAYNRLWMTWHRDIWESDLRKEDSWRVIKAQAELVISTVPAPVLCKAGHQFKFQKVYAIGDAPERGVKVPMSVPDFTVVCNGLLEPSWYRASTVYGYSTLEYPIQNGKKPPFPGVSEVTKPISTNCDCRKEVKRVGRYGAWTKGKLVSDVFADVVEILEAV